MMTEIDHGTRCSSHVGEVFPPRCNDCSLAASEQIDERIRDRVRRRMPVIEFFEDHLEHAAGDLDAALASLISEIKEMTNRG